MARIDAAGAEVNSLNELDSTTDSAIGGTHSFSISTAQANAGTRSFRALRSGVSTAGQAFGTMNTPGTNPTSFAVQIWVHLAFAGMAMDTDHDIIRLDFGAAETLTVRVRPSTGLPNSATWTLLYGSGNSTFTGTYVCNNTWVSVVVRGTVNTGVGATETASLRIRGPTFDETVTPTAQNYATTGLASVNFGAMTSATTNFDAYFDGIIVDNANADITPDRFLLYRPITTGGGTWANFGAGADNAARVIDNSDTTGVRATGSGELNEVFNSASLTTFPTAAVLRTIFGSVRSGDAADLVGGQLYLDDDAFGLYFSTFAQRTTVGTTRSVMAQNIGGSDFSGSYTFYQWSLRKVAGAVTDRVSVMEVWGYYEIEALAALTDSGTVTEAVTITATVDVVDLRSLTETILIEASLGLTDSITETQATAFDVTVGLTDTIALTEAAPEITADVSLSDSITEVMAITAVEVSLELLDTLTETPTLSIAAEVNVTDSITGSDTVSYEIFTGGGGGGTTLLINVNE